MILVFGDLILDRTVRVHIKGLSPESHNTLVTKHEQTEYSLGGAGHVAACIKAVYENTRFIGFAAVGSLRWKRIADLLKKAHINYTVDALAYGEHALKTRIVSPTGQLLRIDDETECGLTSDCWSLGTEVRRTLFDCFRKVKVVCLSDYEKGTFSTGAEDLVSYLAQAGVPILVDPGRSGNWSAFSTRHTILKINLQQALAYCGDNVAFSLPIQSTADGYAHILRCMSDRLNATAFKFSHLVMTFGAYGIGCQARDSGRQFFTTCDYSVVPVPVIDTVGAGDIVLATLAAYLATTQLSFESLVAACAIADQRARESTQHQGCWVPTYAGV